MCWNNDNVKVLLISSYFCNLFSSNKLFVFNLNRLYFIYIASAYSLLLPLIICMAFTITNYCRSICYVKNQISLPEAIEQNFIRNLYFYVIVQLATIGQYTIAEFI